MPKEKFKREVEKELTGRETEAWEIIYFKLYKSQIPVIEQAIETAALIASDGQIPGLPGEDLRGFSGGRKPGQRKPGRTFAFDVTVFSSSCPANSGGLSNS
jgi:hypothetical protein